MTNEVKNIAVTKTDLPESSAEVSSTQVSGKKYPHNKQVRNPEMKKEHGLQ